MGVKVTDLDKVQIPFGTELHLVSSFQDSQGQELQEPISKSVELRKVAGFANLIHSHQSYSSGFNTSDVDSVSDFSLYSGGVLDLDDKINHFIFDVPYSNQLCFNFLIEYYVTVIYGNGHTASFKGNHNYIEINGNLLRQFTNSATSVDSTYPPSMFGNQNHQNELFLYRIPFNQQTGENGRRFRVYWRGMNSGATSIGGASVSVSLRYSVTVTDTKNVCGFDAARLYGFDSSGNIINADLNGLLSVDREILAEDLYDLTLIVNGNFINDDDPLDPRLIVSYDRSDLNMSGSIIVTNTTPNYSPSARTYSVSLETDSGQSVAVDGTLQITVRYRCTDPTSANQDVDIFRNYAITFSPPANEGSTGSGTGTGTSTGGTSGTPTATPSMSISEAFTPYWYETGTQSNIVAVSAGVTPMDQLYYHNNMNYILSQYPLASVDVQVDNQKVSGASNNSPQWYYVSPSEGGMSLSADWFGVSTVYLRLVDPTLGQLAAWTLTLTIDQTSGA